MQQTQFQFVEIGPNLFIFTGAVNTGILRQGERAVLIDCDDMLTAQRLAELGITQVERIYCTQHRRPNTAGIAALQAAVYAPEGERRQFEQASAYWQDYRNRWHLYHFRPGLLAPIRDIRLAGTVCGEDVFAWGGFSVRVIDTPGMTDGAVSYLIHPVDGADSVCFSGDMLYAAGQVWDVHSLQKKMSTFSDYHGFLGAAQTLIASLCKLEESGAGCLVPAHGSLITEPVAALQLTAARLQELYRNYAAISALNFYFPDIFEELHGDPLRLPPAQVREFPAFILPVAATSFAIRSQSGALFLIDCGYDSVLDVLKTWQAQGVYTALEGCWVTHYHDDHVDSLHHLATSRSVPIFADSHIAEILMHPQRFLLPCISPATAPVAHLTRHAETWRWHEFELTALHLPGQSYYHGGLLLRGQGISVLFCGDSFAPTGLDDYTAGNRNFLGAGKGYRRCIDLLREYQPDLILNQHQQKGFCFNETQLAWMEKLLIEREALLAELLPWEHANFGTDEGWIRAYPYDLDAYAGGRCVLEIRATNHSTAEVEWRVEAVLSEGWRSRAEAPAAQPGEGFVEENLLRLGVSIDVPAETAAGCYPVAFRVFWNGCYLGQVCHALVRVM